MSILTWFQMRGWEYEQQQQYKETHNSFSSLKIFTLWIFKKKSNIIKLLFWPNLSLKLKIHKIFVKPIITNEQKQKKYFNFCCYCWIETL